MSARAPRPARAWNPVTAGSAPARSRAAAAMARPIGVLAVGLDGGGPAPAASPSSTSAAATVSVRAISPRVRVPVLSKTTVVMRRVRSRTSTLLMSMPSSAPRPVPTMIAVGVARPERARAGDDQHGHGRDQAGLRVAGQQRPAGEGGQGDGDHHRDEHPGDPVGEALDVGLAGLGVLHEPDDLGQGGLGPDRGGSHGQHAAGVHRGAGHRIADRLLDGHRLAGEHGLVDRAGAVDHLAVGGDLLARADAQQVADHYLLDRHHDLLAVAHHAGPPWRPARAGPGSPGRPGPWPGPRSSGRGPGR